MIEFNTADGEKLTLLHDGAAVKGAPGGDRASLFIGGHCHALLHGYEDLVKEVEGWIYGPDKPEAEENHQTQVGAVELTAQDIERVGGTPVAQVRMELVNAAQATADAALKEAMAARTADVHTDEGNVGHGAAAAAAGHEEAPGAGTEHQPA